MYVGFQLATRFYRISVVDSINLAHCQLAYVNQASFSNPSRPRMYRVGMRANHHHHFMMCAHAIVARRYSTVMKVDLPHWLSCLKMSMSSGPDSLVRVLGISCSHRLGHEANEGSRVRAGQPLQGRNRGNRKFATEFLPPITLCHRGRHRYLSYLDRSRQLVVFLFASTGLRTLTTKKTTSVTFSSLVLHSTPATSLPPVPRQDAFAMSSTPAKTRIGPLPLMARCLCGDSLGSHKLAAVPIPFLPWQMARPWHYLSHAVAHSSTSSSGHTLDFWNSRDQCTPIPCRLSLTDVGVDV